MYGYNQTLAGSDAALFPVPLATVGEAGYEFLLPTETARIHEKQGDLLLIKKLFVLVLHVRV